MKENYNRTLQACFVGYVVQAIVNNFVPLLFLTFQRTYGISLEKITLLVTFNFGLQLIIDLVSIGFVDRIGYRASMILAHLLAALGLILLTILPEVMSDPFVGLFLAVLVYAAGGGLLEVLVSPVVEACPTDNKEKARVFCIPFTAGDMWALCLFPPCFLLYLEFPTGRSWL